MVTSGQGGSVCQGTVAISESKVMTWKETEYAGVQTSPHLMVESKAGDGQSHRGLT